MIHVCSLARLHETVETTGARHVITLVGRDTLLTRPNNVDPTNHLFLSINDIVDEVEGMVTPGESHMTELLEFVRSWPRVSPLVIHCYAGVSRSTAAAYVTVCALLPHRDEFELAVRLREASPTATPNAKIVSLGDAALNRNGRMIRAISAIGRGRDCMAGEPFLLSLS